jgi:hypothetical protein
LKEKYLNNKFFRLTLFLFGIFLNSCKPFGGSKWDVQTIVIQKKSLASSLSSVNVSNNQVTINGSGFSNVISVKIKGNSIDTSLNVVSKTNSQIIATATNNLSLLVGSTFDLLLSTADAQSTYSITFTLDRMNATTGQVLKWNGSSWGPATLSSSQVYRGSWNANTNTPALADISVSPSGEYYIVTTAGSQDLGGGSSVNYLVGDWVMSNGGSWDKITGSLSGSGTTNRIPYYSSSSTLSSSPMAVSGSNIGIGIASPGSTLDVKGTLRLSGSNSGYVGFAPSADAGSVTYLLPITQGSAGQVLATDGVASTPTLSWVTPSTNAGTVTGITSTNTDISVGGTAAIPTLTLNSGTNAGQILKLSVNSQLPALDGSLLTSLNPVNLSAPVALNKGGTGSTTQNFVDLTAAQTIAGIKTFSSNIVANISGNITGNAATVTTNANLNGDVSSVGNTTSIGALKVTNGMLAGGIDLTSKVSGILPMANGGSGITSGSQGGIPYFNSSTSSSSSLLLGLNEIVLGGGLSSAPAALGSTGTAGYFLTSGGVGLAPTWSQTLPIANGGTGSTTKNFVDLNTAQSISGAKTFGDTTLLLAGATSGAITLKAPPVAASYVITLPAATGTLALASNITGTNSGTNTGDQTITLTGPVTGSGTGTFATSITAGSIDLATKVTGVLPVANGGTGSISQNFVDLTAAQTIAGVKTFSSNIVANITGNISGNAATVTTNANMTGDVTSSGSNATTVKGINGILLSGLSTGLLKNTATTGVPTIAVAGTDYLIPSGIASALTNTTISNTYNYTNHGLASGDSLAVLFNKLAFDQGDYVSKTADQTINGSLAINPTTGFITVPTPILANDAANKSYVDGFGQWSKSGSDIYRASGNVGFGTTSPGSTLEVGNAGSIAISNQTGAPINSASLPGSLVFKGNGWNTWVGSQPIQGQISMGGAYNGVVSGSTEPYLSFSLLGSGGATGLQQPPGPITMTERMRITNNGYVGIGTSSPGSNLTVAGRIESTISGYKFPDATVQSTAAIPLILANGTNSSTTEVRDFNTWVTRGNGFYVSDVVAPISNSPPNEGAYFAFSQVGIGGAYFAQTAINDHAYYYRGGPTSGVAGATWYRSLQVPSSSKTAFTVDGAKNANLNVVDNADLIISTNNSEKLRIKAAGNVGIGISNPLAKLAVNGDISASNLSLNGATLGNIGLSIFNSGDYDSSISLYSDGMGNTSISSTSNTTGTLSINSDHNLGINSLNTYFWGGNVGIGITSPGYKLDVQGGDINASGNVRAAGIALTSDRRWKRNIMPLKNSIEKIMMINGVSYDWAIDDYPEKHFTNKKQIGVIAQNIQAVFPELVLEDNEGYLSVNYSALIAPLIEAFKSQHIQLEANMKMFKTMQGEFEEIKLIVAENKREIASLQAQTVKLEKENLTLKAQAVNLENENNAMKKESTQIKARLEKIEKMLNSNKLNFHR